MMEIAIEQIISVLLEKFNAFITDKKEEKALKDELNNNYIRYFKEKFESLPMSKEFDINALNNHLIENLDTKVKLCLIAASIKQRSFYKDSLLENSYTIAKADTDDKKRGVYAYIDSFLNIYENFLKSKINEKDQYLINEQTEELKTIIQSEKENLENFIKYHGSFAEFIDRIETFSMSKTDFHYLNPKIGFVRRDAQFEFLNNFLKDDQPVLSLVITGSGGIGKSKLLHQYILERLYDIPWKAVMLDRSLVDDLCSHQEWKYPKNLLIVIDYAAEKSKIIGGWIRKINRFNSRPRKIRIIMLERQGVRKDNEQIILPFWYQTMMEESGGVLNEIQYGYENGFYELPPFNKDEMFQIMDMHPGGKPKPCQEKKEAIYKKILSFSNNYQDKRFNTPLIALLLTDAYMNNEEVPNPEHLMRYVIKRNRNSLKHILQIDENQEELLNSLESLMVYATAIDGCNLEDNLPTPLVDDRQKLYDFLDADILETLLVFISEEAQKHQRINAADEKNYQLAPLKPDIIGEYFVLEYISRKHKSEKCKQIIEACWNKSEDFLFFLIRCVHSYLGNFENLIFGKQPVLFYGTEPLFQSMVLFEITATPNKDLSQKAIEHIEKLFQKYKETSIAIIYAKGLFNLSDEQKVMEAAETVNKLKELCDNYPNNAEIALEYAKGLVNLSSKQEVMKAAETVDKLKDLYDNYPNNEEIASVYAVGLFNLSSKQKVMDAAETVDKLKKLCDNYPNNVEIALVYAKGLVNLSNKQEVTEAAETVNKLKKLCDNHPKNVEIALVYASGLVNLSIEQEVTEAAETVDKLKELYDNYPNNKEIALAYATGRLAILSKK
ncbi:MAG: hypothetical protein GX245_04630 [Eubacteriaceae bacterium]|nr:hypothetical protein [Eubacteriaceae bacterium]